jgi:hypothetical protein
MIMTTDLTLAFAASPKPVSDAVCSFTGSHTA